MEIKFRNSLLMVLGSILLFLPVLASKSPIDDLQNLAIRGNIEAQLALGTLYHYGEGVTRNEMRAFQWYLRAANQGDPRAQSNIGLMYATGEGVEQDDKRAVEWYLKAAKQGNLSAQFNLGTMYDTGRGIQQNYTKAAQWFLAAARQKDAESQFSLGLMYLRGEGVKKDYVRAYKWVYLAELFAKNRDTEIYKNARNRITENMKPQDLVKAKNLAENWLTEN